MPKVNRKLIERDGGGHIGFRLFGHIFAEELDNFSTKKQQILM